MNPTHKDTIYIDVDDEITSIIDKVSNSSSKLVAVVLPKRATMLQSSVNMKLLKKASDAAHKKIVLITSETSLLPLAGLASLHVAKTLQSKPEIPDSTDAIEEASGGDYIDASEDESEEFDTKKVANKPIGKLAGLPDETDDEPKRAMPELTPLPIPRSTSDESAIEIDNTDEERPAENKKDDKPKEPIDKKLKVPNFEKFRVRLMIGFILLIVIIIGFILANSILPKASITIYTKTSNLSNTFTVSLDSTATSVNPSSSTVPAQIQQTQKTASQQVATTGQKNEGNYATGSVTMTAQECNTIQPPSDVPAGVGVSVDNLTFITQQDTSFSFSKILNNCINYVANKSTGITAQNAGSTYNGQTGPFVVAGRSDVSASSTQATSGGTDSIVQIVTQADITNAEQKISSTDTSSIKSALSTSLQQSGAMPITDSFVANQPTIATSANVGDQATDVTVTETTTYSMFGVKESYLQTLVNNSIDQQINTSQQSIVNNGLSNASFSVINQSATSAQITFPTTASIGPKFDLDGLKKQVAGKRAGDVRTIIESNPGVISVTVHYSPFWVTTTPKNVAKITIVVKKSQ